MVRLNGDFTLSLPRKIFVEFIVLTGVIFGCSIFVDFIGFADVPLDGMEEFFVWELGVVVVGFIDDNLVYTDDIWVLLRGGDDLIVIVGICLDFMSSFGDLRGESNGLSWNKIGNM